MKTNEIKKADAEFKKGKFSKEAKCDEVKRPGANKPKFKGGKSKPEGRELRAPKNDPSFYTRYKELADNAARIAFNHRNGSAINCAYGSTTMNRNIDPIMILQYVPTPGISVSKSSGINVSAQAAHKVLNRKYRGSPSSRYQAADLGISQFAIMDFYLSLAQAERVYGICQVARVNQRQVPRELVWALGYDYDDIANNMANFRAKLNALIIRAQVLCLVKGYSFMDHHLFLLSNVFKDKDTARGQYFAYKKPGYWKWNPTKFATGSAVEWVPNHESKTVNGVIGTTTYYGLQTIDDVITNLDAQLTPLLGDSDIDVICADILALFESDADNQLLKLSFLPDGYMVDPIFDQDALYQLHNTVIPVRAQFSTTRTFPLDTTDVEKQFATPYPVSVLPTGETGSNHTGLFVYQVDDTIRFDVQFAQSGLTQITEGTSKVYGSTSTSNDQISYPLLDTDKLNPTPDEVMEMTRNVCIAYRHGPVADSGNNYYIHDIESMGTVLVTACLLFQIYDVGNYSVDSNGDYVIPAYGATWNTIRTIGAIHPNIAKFDWYPMLFDQSNIIADLDNYRGIDLPVLNPIHEAAVLSEFHNPISDILIKDI